MSIIIKAYINGNVGDDIMIATLCNQYPNNKFVVVGNSEYKNNFKECKNLAYICEDTFFNRIKTFLFRRRIHNKSVGYAEYLLYKKSFDYRIVLGGSMFIERGEVGDKMAIDNIWFGNRTLIVGFNFGPYHNKQFLEFYRNGFSRCLELTTRDYKSVSLFEEYCNIHCYPDIVFSRKARYETNQGPEVIISIVSEISIPVSKEYYIELICKIIDEVSKRGLTPVLASFCKTEGDEAMAYDIQSRTDNECKLLFYNGDNLNEMEKRFASANCIVASRFHAMVLAFLYKKKCIPIVYSNKTKNALIDMNFGGCVLDLLSPPAIESVDATDIVNNASSCIDDEYIMKSKFHFSVLDRYLL